MTIPTGTPISHHIGFSVRDAEATAKRYEQMVGATFRLMPPYVLTDMYGHPAGLKVYYGAMAGMAVEIIETTSGTTPHSEWLREHGEGIQHIGLYVPDLLAATRDAVAKGGRIEWVYPSKGVIQLSASSTVEEILSEVAEHSLVYVDVKEGGTILELLGPPIHQAVFGGALKGLEELIDTKLPPVS